MRTVEGPRLRSGRKRRAVGSHDDDKAIGPSIAQVRKQQKIPVKPTADKDGECFCAPHCFCDNCPPAKKDVARHGCVDHMARYHAATNVVMSMDHSDEKNQGSFYYPSEDQMEKTRQLKLQLQSNLKRKDATGREAARQNSVPYVGAVTRAAIRRLTEKH